MMGIFDVLSIQEFTIEGSCYKAMELPEYLDKYRPAEAKKRLEKAVKEKDSLFYDDRKDRAICIKNQETGRDMLITGNALLIALIAGEYDILRELMDFVMLEDGKLLSFGDEFQQSIGVSEQDLRIFNLLLNPKTFPEDIRMLLWEKIAEQNQGMEKYMADLKWPMVNGIEEMLLWSKELFQLKKYPKLYDKLMTEEFICDYLWQVSAWYGVATKPDKVQMLKKLKPITTGLKDAEAMWNVVKKHKSNELEFHFSSGWNEVQEYIGLWKKLTGQPVCLSVKGDPYWKKCMEKGVDINDCYSCSSFISMVVKCVDRITDASTLKKEKLFEFFLQEGKEVELLRALKVDLLTKKMLPKAMEYAEDQQQYWAVPLLMLKNHDELETGEAS